MQDDDGLLSDLRTNRIAEHKPQIPIIVVGSPPLRRLQAGGWFSRGFTATTGIMLALTIFLVGLPVVGMLFLGGGLSYLMHRHEVRSAELTEYAKSMAVPELRKKGVVAVADDAGAFQEGGDVYFVGKGRNSSGKLCNFAVRWRVASFGGKQNWEWVSLTVNGEESRYK